MSNEFSSSESEELINAYLICAKPAVAVLDTRLKLLRCQIETEEATSVAKREGQDGFEIEQAIRWLA